MATTVVVTPKFRCSFMSVLRPKLNNLSGQMEYGVVALIPKSVGVEGIKAAWDQVVNEEFGDDRYKLEDLRPFYQKNKDDKGAVSDGDRKYARTKPDKKAQYEAYREHWVMNLKTTEDRPPKVVDENKEEIMSIADFKSGDYARAVIEISSYENSLGPQCSIRLKVVQKLADGPAFGGGISAEAAMDLLPEDEDNSAADEYL